MTFLRFIAMMTGALLFVSLLFFIIMPKSPASNVAYTLTISINFVAFFGSVIGSILLRKKDKQLLINEQENITQKIQKEKIEGEGN